jgi:hypothetical protein
LILFEDDVNYYRYFRGRGLASRLVLDGDGDIRAEHLKDKTAHFTSADIVPLVDEAVRRHPEFSARGAKGVLALTGYDGLFGERHLGRRPTARGRVRELDKRLRETGWSIASHTFGHINLGEASVTTIARDTARWEKVTEDVIAPTDMLVYPFGSRPTSDGRAFLLRHGFRVQFDIDVRPERVVEDGVVLISRRHVDGLAFQHPRRLARFFSVRRVRDPRRPR